MAPYNIGIKVQYPSGTNLANINVTCRVESTNESKTLTSNSAGEVIFALGSVAQFPSGFKVGDKVTIFSLYQGFQQTASFSIPGSGASVVVKDNSAVTVGTATGGGLAGTLVLVTVPTAPSLRYFKAQEFLDFFNFEIFEDDNENGIKMQQLVLMGESVENDIDSDCDSKFDDNSGSYYSQTEHLDTDKDSDCVFLTKRPINSVTAIYTTQNDSETTPDYTNNTTEWTSLTEGTDFIIDKTTGRVQITNSSYQPISRKWGLYADYKYGRSSVPPEIRQLALFETAIRMGLTSVVRAKIGDRNTNETNFLDWFNRFRMRIIGKYKHRGIHNV